MSKDECVRQGLSDLLVLVTTGCSEHWFLASLNESASGLFEFVICVHEFELFPK